MAASYKCTSVGCYSYQSPETHQLFQTLQTRINQFAAVAAIEPLKVDGVIGKGTTQAALLVLGFIGEIDSGVVGGSARALENGISTAEQLASNAQSVVDTLTLATRQPPPQIAGQISQPAPIPSSGSAPSATQIATTTANAPLKTTSAGTAQRLQAIQMKRPALAANLLERVPPWLAYASGAILAVGAIGAVVVTKRKRSAAPAVAGW